MAVQGDAAFSSNSQNSCFSVTLMLEQALFHNEGHAGSVRDKREIVGVLLATL